MLSPGPMAINGDDDNAGSDHFYINRIQRVQIQRRRLTFLSDLLIIGRKVAFSGDDRGQPQLPEIPKKSTSTKIHDFKAYSLMLSTSSAPSAWT